MSARFQTILIPVDFTLNTEVAIAKTLGLAESGANIYLLHIHKPGLLQSLLNEVTGNAGTTDHSRIQQKLMHLVARIHNINPQLRVNCWIENGAHVEEIIARKALDLNVDLIVIGKHGSGLLSILKRKVVSARIASATGIPVLTAKPGSLKNQIRTVVIPVGSKFPKRKLELLESWKGKPGFSIRLVSCLGHNKEDECSKDSLLNTFRMLKTSWSGAVEYDVVRGNNQVKALLKYCRKVNADMLIVYPGVETNAGIFPGRHIADLLPPDSRTQILAIQPV